MPYAERHVTSSVLNLTFDWAAGSVLYMHIHLQIQLWQDVVSYHLYYKETLSSLQVPLGSCLGNLTSEILFTCHWCKLHCVKVLLRYVFIFKDLLSMKIWQVDSVDFLFLFLLLCGECCWKYINCAKNRPSVLLFVVFNWECGSIFQQWLCCWWCFSDFKITVGPVC